MPPSQWLMFTFSYNAHRTHAGWTLWFAGIGCSICFCCFHTYARERERDGGGAEREGDGEGERARAYASTKMMIKPRNGACSICLFVCLFGFSDAHILFLLCFSPPAPTAATDAAALFSPQKIFGKWFECQQNGTNVRESLTADFCRII